MCAGLAIERREIPDELITKFHLSDRIHKRGDGTEEVQFQFRDRIPLIPFWKDGEMKIALWGNRGDKALKLPLTGWCRKESLEGGKWGYLHPEEVDIPCNYGLEKGVWFQITEGMKGVLVYDKEKRPHVYMMTQPASHYYEVMTRHDRMPIFIGKGI